MKIVKFEDGKYGIRKLSLFGYEYYDFDTPTMSYFWPRHSSMFLKGYCFTSLTTAREWLQKLTNKGEVVDVQMY